MVFLCKSSEWGDSIEKFTAWRVISTLKFHLKNRYRTHGFTIRAISLHAQVQFHGKYPFFDGQSDREFTLSYAIL